MKNTIKKQRLNIRKKILKALQGGAYPFTVGPSIKAKIAREQVKFFINLLGLKDSSRQQKYYLGNVLKKLIKDKLIIVSNDSFLSLSEKGQRELAKHELGDYFSVQPSFWDGKYRVIIFDVPEQKRLLRDSLRLKLIEWGFIRLQNSVWVYPHSCQEALSLLKILFGINADVLYMEVSYLENDMWLKEEFALV